MCIRDRDYTALIRKQVIKELNLGGRRPQDIDTILGRREETLTLANSYTDLHNRAGVTIDNMALMQLAEDLEQWKKTMIIGEQK